MVLSEQDLEVARSVLKVIKGKRYKDWNYLFLTPFDLNQVPGYLDVIAKPLDLQTVSQNLDNGLYGSLDDVWTDIKTTFENAITYHAERETKWIAKMARDMIKFFDQARKSVEKKKEIASSAAGTKTANNNTTVKLKLGKQLPTAAAASKAAVPTSKSPSSSHLKTTSTTTTPTNSTSPKTTDSNTATGDMPTKPKSQKIKVKLSSIKTNETASTNNSIATPTSPPTVTLDPPKPKIRLKLKTQTTGNNNNNNNNNSNNTASVNNKTPPTPSTTPSNNLQTQSSTLSNKSSSSTKSSKPNKLTVKLANSRGKELPKGVVQPTPTASSTSSKSTTVPGSTTTPSSSVPSQTPPTTNTASGPAASASAKPGSTPAQQNRKRSAKLISKDTSSSASTNPAAGLTPAQFQACAKVLLALKRRKQKGVAWFLNPVTDKTIIQDYRSKIKHPMDIGKISVKVENKIYKTLADFCLDLRRIFSNCLCFNTSMKDSLRPVAVDLIETSEELMNFFFSENGVPQHPKLLYCWKLCMDFLGTLYNIENPDDGQPTVLYFLHPVKNYCGGQFPSDYLEKVKKPMDFQTITSNLLEARYQSVAEFAADCKLIAQNCNTYYSGKDEGRLYVEQANRLEGVMAQQLEQLIRYDKSAKGAEQRLLANSVTMAIVRPPPSILMSVLEDLRALKYTDKATKITEPAMGPFEKPVSLTVFPDYLQHISEQMDLQTIERKVNSNVYSSPEDFEYDMNLIFRNCEKYHSQRNGEHLVSMAKFATKNFRRIFAAKMKALEDPALALATKSDASTPQPAENISTASSSGVPPPAKKQKVDAGSSAGTKVTKAGPRVSINVAPSATSNTSAPTASRAKSPKPPGPTQKKASTPPKAVVVDQPVPLHIAIAKVKEAFPLRRAVKSLVSWESDCARYFKELLRHPWLSAARPKFIFHVPVTMLFPELREAYAAKIRKPMDLTTVECTLLAGGRYTCCEDMLEDVSLTFSNAIRFNKDGRDIGDPLSCAYYDASFHLLRYARWLSLELLSAYVVDSDHVDLAGPDGLPPLCWKLTRKNRELAQKEQIDIVLKEPIEKSLEGDRYTWHESECEKLLKALRHQSDVKFMHYFIRADYPADYTAFISKPMDWEKVQKNLKKRHYDNFGQIIEDLRLIFKNALKYNARMKDRSDTVSGCAYAGAEYMSAKLETAIRKLMLSVSDRIERERIDHANAEREIDAEQKAEEARIRAAWKKDPGGKDGSSPVQSGEGGVPDSDEKGGINLGQKIRLVKRQTVRKEATDFEIPFFEDEDDAHHERSFIDLIKMQKSMFEKQRQELTRMRQTSASVGSAVFSRNVQRSLAQKWMEQELASTVDSVPMRENAPESTVGGSSESNVAGAGDKQQPTSVGIVLASANRGPIKIALATTKRKRKRGNVVKSNANPLEN